MNDIKKGKHDAEIASADANKPLEIKKRNKTKRKLSPAEVEIEVRRKTGGASKPVAGTRPKR